MHIDFDGAGPARNYPATSRADAKATAPSQSTTNRRASFAEVSADIEGQTEPASACHAAAQKPAQSVSYWENADFSFGDLLDTINPLQHLPIVATLYRNMTGDRIGVVPRVVGGALWGRIGGLASGVLNAVVEWFTGKDLGDHIYAYLREKFATSADVQTANNEKTDEKVEEPTEVTDLAAPRHSSVRGPLATQSAFEDLASYPRAESELGHPGRSFRYGSAAADAQAPSSPRRLRLSA